MTGIRRVLVANRGEIALRIIRACREAGIESVAVYSEVDRQSPHVGAADAAVEIGPAQASASYLDIEKLISTARAADCDAVHPGYGFLAERALFAEAVRDAGMVFVGPSPESIRAMGEKTEARRRMLESGVPLIPGTMEPVDSVEEAQAEAERIGYPVMLKAASGGGGKGMRKVMSARELASAFDQASSEARSAFGDGSVYLEKFIERPRHVEVQVLADLHGHTIHVGERECSIQRRHQKLIEETPSPIVDAAMREEMGRAAVAAARAADYTGAGTVEFLVSGEGSFYFLEMNTRIQVEHPITEMVYGVDLVKAQLAIAGGGTLDWVQEELRPMGHAVECRIVAEDPHQGFLPVTGRIEYLKVPNGPGVRWDGGIAPGNEIGLWYDPLLAKLIVWAEDRPSALVRMGRALRELMIVGIPTSQHLQLRIMEEENFKAGNYHIDYLERDGKHLLEPEELEPEKLRELVLAAALAEHQRRRTPEASVSAVANERSSRWLEAARRDGLR